MNMRERMVAVVRGEEHDCVPFVQYTCITAPNEEVWAEVGRDNIGILYWLFPYRNETPNCRFETEPIEVNGMRGERTTIHTPKGSISQEKLFNRILGSGAVWKHYIRDVEDYQALLAYFNDITVVADPDYFFRVDKELGNDGFPHVSVPETPFQQLWVNWVCLEDLCLHMIDYPDLMDDVISAIGKHLRATFEVVRRLPTPYVVFPDNVTAPVIGEKYFRQYCLPYYIELADMLEGTGILTYAHFDGDLKPLWKAIGESKLRGLDSFSPPPDNDTGVGQAAEMWPDMRLCVNFPSSVHLASSEVIRETADRILSEAGHTGRLQIQISENMPPGVWHKSYPIIINAIREFGKP